MLFRSESFRAGKQRLVHSMDEETRTRWLDTRDRLRRERVELWGAAQQSVERKNKTRPSPRERAEAVSNLIERMGRGPEPANN